MFLRTARSGQGRAVFARRSEPLTARTVLQNGIEGKGGIRRHLCKAFYGDCILPPGKPLRQFFGFSFLLSDCTIFFPIRLFRQLRSFALPFFRRKPYIRLQLLQEPIPRAGVAINVQPQRAMAGSALTRASAKECSQPAFWRRPSASAADPDKLPAFSKSSTRLRPYVGQWPQRPSDDSSCA
jgi:hypothetical protein